MVAKKTYTKVCKDCGVEFEGVRNSQYCPECKVARRKKTHKRYNRKRILRSNHEELKDEIRNKRYGILKTRINYDPRKDYFEHDDERYNGNLGDDYNDIYSRKHEDEDWYKYHLKLKELKGMLYE